MLSQQLSAGRSQPVEAGAMVIERLRGLFYRRSWFLPVQDAVRISQAMLIAVSLGPQLPLLAGSETTVPPPYVR
jgi:hypothetical protein